MSRKLGQHFLRDKRALQKIAAALEIASRDTIVEIGPGHGELTKFLVKADPKTLIAVEKDKKLAALLRQKFQDIKIIEGDILKVLPHLAPRHLPPATNYKLTGNIPYYLTGYLFRKISELEKKPRLIVFTIQKEVAERIVTQPPRMNLLAASIQFWGRPQITGYISKKSFRPPPKVDSAIIKIISSSRVSHSRLEGISAEHYYKFIKILFKQPRKTALNNLRSALKASQKEIEAQLQKLNIAPDARPANLSISDINKLATNFSLIKGYN